MLRKTCIFSRTWIMNHFGRDPRISLTHSTTEKVTSNPETWCPNFSKFCDIWFTLVLGIFQLKFHWKRGGAEVKKLKVHGLHSSWFMLPNLDINLVSISYIATSMAGSRLIYYSKKKPNGLCCWTDFGAQNSVNARMLQLVEMFFVDLFVHEDLMK